MANRISVSIAAGEGKRAQALALAVAEDPRFEPLQVDSGLPVDVAFSIDAQCDAHFCIDGHLDDYSRCMCCGGTGIRKRVLNVELKEPADYIQSALSPSGHLYDQILKIREACCPGMVLVLGGDTQVTEAILDSLQTRYRGKELAFNIASYESRLIDFEANAEALGCPVRRWQVSPWKRLLSTAHKILTGGDLMGYRPRPADGERELVAASCLFKGIGPETMKNILAEYQLCFAPRNGYAKPLEEIPGIGKKRAEMISPHIRMTYLERVKA